MLPVLVAAILWGRGCAANEFCCTAPAQSHSKRVKEVYQDSPLQISENIWDLCDVRPVECLIYLYRSQQKINPKSRLWWIPLPERGDRHPKNYRLALGWGEPKATCRNLFIYVPLKGRCSSKVQMEILDKLRDGQQAEQLVKWETCAKGEGVGQVASLRFFGW